MIYFFLDCQAQSAVCVKDEPSGKVGSEHGEEEMEVDSADEQEEDARNQSGQSQISKSRSVATFNTLSSLSSLRPGILLMLAPKLLLVTIFVNSGYLNPIYFILTKYNIHLRAY